MLNYTTQQKNKNALFSQRINFWRMWNIIFTILLVAGISGVDSRGKFFI